MVAGLDLDLVAGEVAQVGNDSGLLGVDGDHGLGAFQGFLVPVVGDARAPGWAGGGGEEGKRSVGDTHHGAPLSQASRRGKESLKCYTGFIEEIKNFKYTKTPNKVVSM